MILSSKGANFDFLRKTYIMGVLNVTPDSFSDGGLYFDRDKAIERGLSLAKEGADIIDIGGESSRPGSNPVSIDEEIKRTAPVISVLSKVLDIPISIDTYKSEVAQEALNAGASMVNDISGTRFDSKMAAVVRKFDVPVIIMHIKGTPSNMQIAPVYQALIPEILEYLREGINICREHGIPDERIIIDPGIGFGKTFEHNLEIINNLKEFSLLGKPIAIGVSRKAFIGKILGDVPPSQRLEGTASAVAISVYNGANIVRVHDVAEISKVVKVADAIKRQVWTV